MPCSRASSRANEGSLVTTSNIDRRYSTSNKYDTITYILINILARLGDIQPNPGPSVKCTKRTLNRSNKCSAKLCNQCLTLTSFRRFTCVSCGELGDLVCPYCITLNIINNHSESNAICEYNCMCVSQITAM